jgi:hypothetical protein
MIIDIIDKLRILRDMHMKHKQDTSAYICEEAATKIEEMRHYCKVKEAEVDLLHCIIGAK